MNQSLSYKDVHLIQNPSNISSRGECKPYPSFLGKVWGSPLVPANMQGTIDFDLADWFAQNNYFYILHRFYDYSVIYEWLQKPRPFNSISVGILKKDFDFVTTISNLNVQYITIDVAHGGLTPVQSMIKHIKKCMPRTKVIAGNIMTQELATILQDCGADALKVGLSMGSACSTYQTTGVGSPMFSTILNIKTHIPIIADGQLRNFGDISKALVAGATLAMSGLMFAACNNSPAQKLGAFFGSASQFNKPNYIEGISMEPPKNNMSYETMILNANKAIQSTMSYNGSTNINNLKNMGWNKWTP